MAFLNPRTKSFLTVILPTCLLNSSSLAIAMWLPTLVHYGPVTTDQTHDLVNCIRLLNIHSCVFCDEEEHSKH
jgi:hypothetical protein